MEFLEITPPTHIVDYPAQCEKKKIRMMAAMTQPMILNVIAICPIPEQLHYQASEK